METIQKEIQKLKFQIQIIKETIDLEEFPLQHLILEFDWGETELKIAHEIFKKHHQLLAEGHKINSQEFEKDFEEKLKINYQGVKSIAFCFYQASCWPEVCHQYIMNFKPRETVEFYSIADPKSQPD